jgi:hypothetical protein
MKKLVEALKKKYGTPQKALLALGLDVDIIELMAQDAKQEPEMAKQVAVIPTRKSALVQGALVTFLRPRMAKDAKIELAPLLRGITHKNFAAKKKELAAKITEATKGKLAKDANIEGLVELIDALEGEAPMERMPEQDGGMEAHPESGEPLPVKMKPGEGEAANRGDPKEPLGHKEEGGERASGMEEEDAEPDAMLADFLREKGMNDADIAEACKLVGGRGADALEEDPNKANDEGEEDMVGQDNPPPFKGMPEPGGTMVGQDGTLYSLGKDKKLHPVLGADKKPVKMVNKAEVDKMISTAVDKAIEKVSKAYDKQLDDAQQLASDRAIAIREAETTVRPVVGELKQAYDSAEQVYTAALVTLGEDEKEMEDLPLTALKAIYKRASAAKASTIKNPRLGSDAKPKAGAREDFLKRHPGAARLGHVN